ncbi:MAG TPA: 4-hydroxythreonine-4-phosphate dehydrogenase PdxA [Kiritimatiellia bacterium]|nr:4-hydroxythreonine-4-phosphate dehydrogenase PdxA [Kiritimatiellia bacterium]
MSKPVRIGITSGDINGIGLEVALKALHEHRWPANLQFVIIGDAAITARQCNKFGIPAPVPWNGKQTIKQRGRISLWHVDAPAPLEWVPGTMSAPAAMAAAEWIRAGVHACQSGLLDALVTAPISKAAFHHAGIDVPGHTEMLAQLTGTRNVVMMLAGGALRVALVTRHVPISEVPSRIRGPILSQTITITSQALAWMGLKRRRIAVCGLNPHAGEGGDIGKEEIRVIAPAIARLKRKGLDVHGPLPGDTVFHFAAAGQYDAVVAMYHDQGLAPLKLAAFDSGVNITLGLPIVRTSPDHGTAFNIAGKNKANPSSMVAAITEAYHLAGRKNPWAARRK